MNIPKFKIRSHATGKIMGNLKTITDTQFADMRKLEAREEVKPLTTKQEEKLTGLQAKYEKSINAKPSDKLPETAKTYIKEWIKEQLYGRRKDISNKYLRKGIDGEDEAINLLMEYKDLTWNSKNEVRKSNEHMTGECDLLYDDRIYDTKCSYDCFSFPLFQSEIRPNHDYYYQGQVYMDLYGPRNFTVAYVLVNTPADIVEQQIKRESYGLNEEGSNKVFERVAAYHCYDKIDMRNRIKCFDFTYDESVIQRIVARVELCREYIKEITGELV